MATKQDSINSCKRFKQTNPDKKYFIYRVGPAWMFTSELFSEVQAKYKVTVCDYQEITL